MNSASTLDDRFAVEFSARASRELKKLERHTQVRLLKAVGLLRDHPRPPAAVSLTGRPHLLRVRVGDYRIIYTVEDKKLLVLVLRVGHRRDVARNPL